MLTLKIGEANKDRIGHFANDEEKTNDLSGSPLKTRLHPLSFLDKWTT